ncbi:MAG TPA: 3-oxoacyl-[acyl-carrier-protein] synthase III C-terminal domain-containing protein, partial [Polyangiales bacterium]|nr:3-oxoacyl-[acyl-carrier-protein] synthase III C-terminal domain-containing protein [Polyangiales bacterium]
ELAAIVASDSNPGVRAGFRFPNAGGALLLRPGPAGAGFCGFASQTFPEFADRFESYIEWQTRTYTPPFAAPGRNVPVLIEREDYGALAASCGASVAQLLLDRSGLRASDVQLLVASTYPQTLADALARQLSLAPERVARPRPALVGAHTAGILAALEGAWTSGQLAAAGQVLFVAVGAGITAAAALYRPAASG